MELSEITLPKKIGLYDSFTLGTMEGKDGTIFNVIVGLTKAHADELKQKALDDNDALLQNNTSDRRRFGEGSYEAWFKKDRTPFALTDAGGHLAALVYFGPEEPPAELQIQNALQWDTIGLRSYEPYRGKGIMSPFVAIAFDLYRAMRPGRSFWLVTNADNAPVVHIFKKLGFQDRGLQEKTGRQLMALD